MELLPCADWLPALWELSEVLAVELLLGELLEALLELLLELEELDELLEEELLEEELLEEELLEG